MTGSRHLWTAIAWLFVAASAAPVAAQTPPSPDPWRHGATVTVGGGTASASGEVNGLGSGSMSWELTPRLALEGTAFWLDRAHDAGAFAAALSARFDLSPPRRVVPFVDSGFGFYDATFDLRQGTPPAFYRQRGAQPSVGATMVSFTDPMLLVGGGGDVFLNTHLAVRPEIALLLAIHGSQTYDIATVTVRFVYHFERHPLGEATRAARHP
jgi:hypothetical protein